MDLAPPDVARNMRLIGHCDIGGRGDGLQLMVHRSHAYVAHPWSQGFSIVDLRDPRKPGEVTYVAAPPNTWNIHPQTHDDLLLVINALDLFADVETFASEKTYYTRSVGETLAAGARRRAWTAGMTVYDISQPARPRRIGSSTSMASACTGFGTSAGATPTPRRCSTASPTTSSSPSTWPTRRARSCSGAGGCPA
jgi:hypothetical protein